MKSLLQQIGNLYGIPSRYELGRSGGETRIAISAALIFPEVRPHLIALAEKNVISPRMCAHRLTIEKDILGGIISEKPLQFAWEAFKTKWLGAGLKEALDSAIVNPVHLEQSQKLVSAAVVLLKAFENQGLLEGNYLSGGDGVLPDELFCWLKPLRYIQHVPADDYLESVTLFGQAMDIVGLIAVLRSKIPEGRRGSVPHQGIRTNLPKNRLHADLMTKISRLKESDQQRVRKAIEQDERDSLCESIASASMENVLKELSECGSELGRFGTKNHQRSTRREHYISAACGTKSLGHCDFEELCSKAIELFNSSPSEDSAALVVYLFLFCEPSMAPLLKADRERGMVGRDLASFPESVPDPELHQSSGQTFWLPAPDSLLNAVEILSESSPTAETLEKFIQGIRGFEKTTIAKIRNYLLFNASDCLGIGHILPRFGFFSDVASPDVARSYIRVSQPFYKGYINWLNCYFPDFTYRFDLEKIPPAGSPRAVQLAVVREMYAIFTDIISSPLPSHQKGILSNLNVAGSLAHLIGVVFLGGCRNYPGALPMFLTQRNGWMLNFEKQPFLIHLPKRSFEVMHSNKWFKDSCLLALQKLGLYYRIPEQAENGPLKLIQKASETYLQATSLSWLSIRESLLEIDVSWKYALLDQNALRHLSMTALYSSGEIDHHTIEAFHQRSGLILSPFSSGRMEDPLLRAGREKCSEYLFNLITS